MGIKQNLPLLVLGIIVLFGSLLAFVFLRPPEVDRLRSAVLEYAHKQGQVLDVQIDGTVATISLGPEPRRLYVEFVTHRGKWVFGKDLIQDFEAHVRHPHVEREILGRLAARIAQRLGMSVNLREGMQIDLGMQRDPRGVAGLYGIRFAYPKVGHVQKHGRYREVFRYRDGRWASEGEGSLFESAP